MSMNPVNLAFGKAVALRRDELGLTQADLAAQVGMSRASIANIEKGRQNILLYHVYDLAEALKMAKVGDLLPARPKPSAQSKWEISGADGDISASDIAQVNELVSAALAVREAKARS